MSNNYEETKVPFNQVVQVAPRVDATLEFGVFWPVVRIKTTSEKQPIRVAWTRNVLPTIGQLRRFSMRELSY